MIKRKFGARPRVSRFVPEDENPSTENNGGYPTPYDVEENEPGGYNGGYNGGGYNNNNNNQGNNSYNNNNYGNNNYGGGYRGHYGGYNSNNYGYHRNPRPRVSKIKTSNDPIQAMDPFKTETGEILDEIEISGVLELHPNGYGFLRDPGVTYVRQLIDPFVPGNMIENYGLREGVYCTGIMQPGRKNQGPRLREMLSVEGMAPEEYIKVRPFDELTAITPESWYKLETGQEPISTRVMDLLTPLGRGQRALIVAPPRTGKTILMQQISQAISTNYPDVRLFVLLIDERPEEVTDMRRAVRGEVVASSLDRDIESHVRLSQLLIERCKRLAEMGQDVFLLLDSITRLARAFNKWVGNTGRTMSGGVDIKAMDIPKKLFATARQFEEGGSLTIVGTALIDTGSRMDELIFQEFKGTGNMELVLDRRLADRRIWPAIDISQSGTRREEKLLEPDVLHAVTLLRRTLANMNPIEAMEQLTQKLGKRKTNADFINLIMPQRD
ncbi:MAG: transcription termination factor Rho [Planctomycetia bacterium]|nr:transcription termination factor Rho [Planctomycetia bacterium]